MADPMEPNGASAMGASAVGAGEIPNPDMPTLTTSFAASGGNDMEGLGAIGVFIGTMLWMWVLLALVCILIGFAIMYYGSGFMVKHYKIQDNMAWAVYVSFFTPLQSVWWLCLFVAGVQRLFGKSTPTAKASQQDKSGGGEMLGPRPRGKLGRGRKTGRRGRKTGRRKAP